MFIVFFVGFIVLVRGEAEKETKDEYCTDPRTMQKHAAYTEWADAYSCTRHRCQPGGRNLAIYTVGCKRVEAPESAIECEEVVEDTNMQFPYCCTRLRCLVVVRGEVWTRVLGQPWETLPAAPWSHMYKMKKPPPVDGSFLPKGQGPVYELAEDHPMDHRAAPSDNTAPVQRASAGAGPDIVIALTTNGEKKPSDAEIQSKFMAAPNDDQTDNNQMEVEELPPVTDKAMFFDSDDEVTFRGIDDDRLKKTAVNNFKAPYSSSDEQYSKYSDKKPKKPKTPVNNFKAPYSSSDEQYSKYADKKAKKPKDNMGSSEDQRFFPSSNLHQKSRSNPKIEPNFDEGFYHQATGKKGVRSPAPESWARVPSQPSNSPAMPRAHLANYKQSEPTAKTGPVNGESEEKQEEKPASLQHLVSAIGTRMRDIENVVQRMSDRVQPADNLEGTRAGRSMPRDNDKIDTTGTAKKAGAENYNRYPSSQGGSKYVHTADTTTEPPLFLGDNLNGYFSDPSNNLLRRSMSKTGPKEPQPGTYTAPIVPQEHLKKSIPEPEGPEKRKKHAHKKKKSKRGRRKHHREERDKKKFSRPTADKNIVSLEDSNDFDAAGKNNGRRTLQLESLVKRRPKPFLSKNQPTATTPPLHYRQHRLLHESPFGRKLLLMKYLQRYAKRQYQRWNL